MTENSALSNSDDDPILIHNQTPTFNLKVVVNETGLKPDTLRAWERRYGLPNPHRTSGGHRLYSARDIAILKWLVARQQEGLSISRAVQVWRKLEAEDQDPLRPEIPVVPSAQEHPETIAQPISGKALAEIREAWVTACQAFDQLKSERLLSQAFAIYPVETVCIEILQGGLAEIGQGWADGTVSVQQEHFASALALRRLDALLNACPSPTRSSRVLIGCPPEEEHIFSPLLATLFLRRQGWDVIYLGANIPIMRMQNTIAEVKPDLAVLVAQNLPTAATLLDMSIVLQEAQVPLAFGGLVFNQIPALQSLLPGYFLGEQLDQAIQQVQQLLSSPHLLASSQEKERPTPIRPVLRHFQERQGMLEAEIESLMADSDLVPVQIVEANKQLARHIVAALKLGDLNLLRQEDTWLYTLLDTAAPSRQTLKDYLAAYRQAAKQHLSEDGKPIIDWLTSVDNQLSTD